MRNLKTFLSFILALSSPLIASSQIIGQFVKEFYPDAFQASNGIWYVPNEDGTAMLSWEYYMDTQKNYKTLATSNGGNGNIVIPSSVTNDGKTYTVTSLGYGAFYYCEALESLILPNTITLIKSYNFWYTKNLRSIYLPNSLQRNEGSFYNCDELEAVYISDLEAWFNINFTGSLSNPLNQAHKLYLNGELVTTITIPETITTIHANVLYGASCIKEITCHEGITEIGDRALANCVNLEKFTFNEGLITIGDNAFENCLSLENFVLPESLMVIEDCVFQGCETITEVKLPSNLKELGTSCFRDCYQLRKFVFPTRSFNMLTQQFNHCHSLMEVICNIPTPPYLTQDIFYDTPMLTAGTLYVPASSIEKYKEAKGWKEAYRIEGINEEAAVSTLFDDTTSKNYIYDLTGKKIISTLESLSPGVYIINGKKTYIRR